jgi:UDP-GlcNAc:undecaprenyl-phosphate GlcNAc-1-phosphate transferase
MLLAVVRRTMRGMSPFDADRQHLHHRLLNLGHSHRQSVLLMYLWAALFSGLVVGLSLLRIQIIYFALITLAAIAALLLATAPKLRFWTGGGKRGRARGTRPRSADTGSTPAPGLAAPVSGPVTGPRAVRPDQAYAAPEHQPYAAPGHQPYPAPDHQPYPAPDQYQYPEQRYQSPERAGGGQHAAPPYSPPWSQRP